MSTREQIAKKAAKVAAVSAYKTIMNAKISKTASAGKKKITIKNIAKVAAVSAYNAIMKSAQSVEIDPQNLSMLLSKYPKLKELYDFYQSNGDFTMPKQQFNQGGYAQEVKNLINDVKMAQQRDPAAPSPQAVYNALNKFLLSHIEQI